MLVFPKLIVAGLRNRVTVWASTSGTDSAKAREPYVVRTPAVSTRSLTAVGTPNSGEVSSFPRPFWTAAACATASSPVTVRKAP